MTKFKKIKQLKKECQYNLPNCQKVTEFQHIIKLGVVTIDKGWACANCKDIIQKEQKEK